MMEVDIEELLHQIHTEWEREGVGEGGWEGEGG